MVMRKSTISGPYRHWKDVGKIWKTMLLCNTEATDGNVLKKKTFLKILQNLQENIFVEVSFLMRLQASSLELQASIGVFL